MKIPKSIKVAISLAMLTIVIKFIGLQKILITISKINLVYIIPIIAIYLISFIIEAINIQILLKTINAKIKFSRLLKYTVISWSIGLISPGKIGDFSIVYFLKKDNIDTGKGFAVIFMDKIITLIVLFIFAIITTLIFLTEKEFLLVLMLFLLITIGIIIILTEKIRKIIKEKILKNYSKKFSGFYTTIANTVRNNRGILISNFVVTIIKWVVSALNVMLIFLSLGASSNNILLITLISASLTIFNLIPITFHGIGLKEATGIYLYGFLGISPEIIVTTYLIFNILAYSIAAIAIYLLTDEIKKIGGKANNLRH